MKLRTFLWSISLALTFAPKSAVCSDEDYSPENTSWNGLSRFVEILTEEGYTFSLEKQLDWDAAEPNDILVFIYPIRQGESAPDPNLVADFLRRGGRVLLADDFGAAGGSLESLGLIRVAELPPNLESYSDNPALPFAEPVPGHGLGNGVDLLLTNHPTAFHSELTPAFVLGRPPERAEPDPALYSVVVEGGLEEGRIIALSDPSVLINAMMAYEGNERFARNLLFHLAGPPPGRGKFRLFIGKFAEWGRGGNKDPFDALSRAGAIQDFLTEFNRWLGELSLYAPKGELARLMAALLALAAFLGVLARLAQSPIRYDGHWLGSTPGPAPGVLTPEQKLSEGGASEEALLDTFRIAVEEFMRDPDFDLGRAPGGKRRVERRLAHLLTQVRALPTRRARPGKLARLYREWLALLEEAELLDLWKRRTRS